MSPQSLADRLALRVCKDVWRVDCEWTPCTNICSFCRRVSAGQGAEMAQVLRERHGGSSQVADMLDGLQG
jgi:hypothetical protein